MIEFGGQDNFMITLHMAKQFAVIIQLSCLCRSHLSYKLAKGFFSFHSLQCFAAQLAIMRRHKRIQIKGPNLNLNYDHIQDMCASDRNEDEPADDPIGQ